MYFEVRVGFVGFVPAPVKLPEVTGIDHFESPGRLYKNRRTVGPCLLKVA